MFKNKIFRKFLNFLYLLAAVLVLVVIMNINFKAWLIIGLISAFIIERVIAIGYTHPNAKKPTAIEIIILYLALTAGGYVTCIVLLFGCVSLLIHKIKK